MRCCTASSACRCEPAARDRCLRQRPRLNRPRRKTARCRRPDPEPVERIDAEFHHVLVVGAGDDAEQLDRLRRRQRLERHAHEIRPHVHFLRRAVVDVDEGGLEHVDQDREHLDAVGVRIVRLPEGDRILVVGEREDRLDGASFMTASLARSPVRAAARMRSRVRATAGGRRAGSVMISGSCRGGEVTGRLALAAAAVLCSPAPAAARPERRRLDRLGADRVCAGARAARQSASSK